MQLLYQRLENQNQGDKMEKLDNIKEVKVGEQQTEIDPRSKTTAEKLIT